MGLILLKIGLFFLAYLIGSIPNGVWIGKLFLNINLTEHGSKNTGASNAIRVMGLKLGILTLILDAFKASFVIILAKYLFPLMIYDFTTTITIFSKTYDYSIVYGLFAIIGHTFSLFLKFKGGKAVAPSLGIVITLTPYIGILAIVVYTIVVLLTKYASVGSTFAAFAVGIGTIVQFLIQGNFQKQLFVVIVYWLMILFIFYRHIPNYKRLIKGTETKMKLGKKAKDEQ